MTVNSVLPGPTASEGVATFVGQMADARGVDSDDDGARVLRHRAAVVAAAALRHAGRGGGDDRLRLQRAGVGTNGAALRVDGGVMRSMV